ncbi:alpha/beta hydrolase family protein [Aliikangiella sp. IMCC44653]
MKNLWLACLLFFTSGVYAQDSVLYQKPSQEILELVDVKLAPTTLVDDAQKNMLLLSRDTYKSIETLSKQEMRLAGLRIDPQTNIGSRVTYYNDVKIQKIATKQTLAISGLPAKPRLTNFQWSPNQQYMAMTHTSDSGLELWLIDIPKATARQLSKLNLNANMRDVINWFADSQSLLVKALPKKRKALIDAKAAIPTGPTISVSDGKKAQNRTYQDLLKNKTDEFNFEQLAKAKIYRVDLKGKATEWLAAGMYADVSISPNGKYVLVTEHKKPFSYLVPYYRFPMTVNVYSHKGKKISQIADVPLIEDLPKGFMAVRKGPRNIGWRDDKPASLVYTQALDNGDPANEVSYRDELIMLNAPFKGEGTRLVKTINRLYRVLWGNDNYAIVEDYWWNNRNTKSYLINPASPKDKVVPFNDRSYQDRYSDPGDFVMQRNQLGRSVLAIAKTKAYLLGDGYSEKGQFPFLDEFDLSTKQSQRVYQSNLTNKLETLRDFSIEKQQLFVRIESKSDYPNYFLRNLATNKVTQITDFENPFKSIQNVTKKVINYQRKDGLDLSGTLYLPVNYEAGKKYPMILWAYPREFKDKSSAAQNTQNPNEFTYPYYGSPIYWVTKGYVVLDDAAFPIVGEGNEEPNDSFRDQLVANAQAAINAVDALGYIDPTKVAVGGHSYGAFMVANLLSHSNLFAAGIARSGAYNRTLTPFGFQSEERSYWEAPQVYNAMSPFMHADKMKTPLLLIHGEADNNSGTYPLQSERYFNALKGLGAPVRLVMLPKESHGYRAKESILHLLWEQDQWLEKHLKSKSQ